MTYFKGPLYSCRVFGVKGIKTNHISAALLVAFGSSVITSTSRTILSSLAALANSVNVSITLRLLLNKFPLLSETFILFVATTSPFLFTPTLTRPEPPTPTVPALLRLH
jgi:hypothetical protein